MKYRILSILCVLCILSGCRVELPPQNTASSSPASTASSEAVSSQRESAQASSSVSNSEIASASSPTSSASKASSIPASSAPVKSKASPPSVAQNKEQSCTLFISCGNILKNKDKFSADKLSIVPESGVIYAEKSVILHDGDTVFDVLLRETKANKIQMEYTTSPIGQTIYIKGINNIYEKAFGGDSGWIYAVNGKQPPVGCNSYRLSSGDKIQWMFVCGQ